MIAIKSVWFDKGLILLNLNNETIIGSPIDWYPNLRKGTLEQWQKYELWDDGQWIHWEELDEDLGLEHFLRDVNTDPEK